MRGPKREIAMTDQTHPAQGQGRVLLSQDRVAGLTLIAISAFALWASSDLETGTLRFIGPGLMPKLLAALVGVCGAILLVLSFLRPSEAMPKIPLRGPLCVLAGILAFALTVQTAGFAVLGPRAGADFGPRSVCASRAEAPPSLRMVSPMRLRATSTSVTRTLTTSPTFTTSLGSFTKRSANWLIWTSPS